MQPTAVHVTFCSGLQVAVEQLTSRHLQMAGQIRLSQTATESRQSSLENRMEANEKLTKDTVESTRWINNRLVSLENRMEPITLNRMESNEKLTKDTVQSVQWTIDRQASLENRMETIESMFDEDHANRFDRQARLENRMESIEKMMDKNDQEIWEFGSFKLLAARDLASAKDRLARLENRLGPI